MIISDDKEFIFIHVEKTGGSSIGQALGAYANPRPGSRLHGACARLIRGRDYHLYRYRTHASLRDVELRMPAQSFNDFFKFAFVRNPWDRLVSEYNAAIRKSRRVRHRRIRAFPGFSHYVQYEIDRGKFFQYPRVCGVDGSPGVDFIGRFENLVDDFSNVCERLGVESKLGHHNRFPHANYREFYDRETREMVRKHWRLDVEYFDYEF